MMSDTVLDIELVSGLLDRFVIDEVNCCAGVVVNISFLSEIPLSFDPV
jgi:hypothetical protein